MTTHESNMNVPLGAGGLTIWKAVTDRGTIAGAADNDADGKQGTLIFLIGVYADEDGRATLVSGEEISRW